MTLQLYECKPMNARISKAQCKTNRTMTDNLSIGIMKDARCKGCPGLGEPTLIDLEEITEMATNKNKPCVKADDGCKALAWKQGYCWKHHPDHMANKKAACADKQATRDIHKVDAAKTVEVFTDVFTEAGWVKGGTLYTEPPPSPPVTEPLPPVTDHESHIINLIDVFKAKQAAEFDMFCCELSKLTEPVDKLLYAYQVVKV